MPALDVNGLKQKASKAMAGFSTGQKVVTGIAVIGLVGGFMMFSSWAGKPSYSPLFTNLQPSDAAAITQKLTSNKVAYKLADGGSTVMVPQSVLYQQRMELSASGLPAGGNDGYKLLDKQGITTSEFRQRVDYQRALEGELAKTIGAIDGVSAATVHLVIPKDDVFAADDHKASASVLVQNIPGKTMSPEQVQAVVHLVSSSVEALDPSAVTVADGKGNVLNAPGDDGMLAAAGDARTQQRFTFENSMAKSLQDMLSQVLGQNHAVVKVTADLDFNQVSTTTETYDDKPAPVVSESTSKENFTGTGTPPNTTGLTGNTTGTATTNNNYTKDDAQRTMAVGKVTSEVKQAPGTVKRLSIAVALDSGAKNADKAQIEQLVSAAAGINAQRGDTVAVNALAFDTSAAQAAQKDLKAAAKAKSQQGMMSLAKTVGVLLIVGVALLLVLRSTKKSVRRVPIALPADLAELEGPRHALAAGAIDLNGDDRVLVGVGAGSHEATSFDSIPTPNLPAAAVANSDIVQLIERQPDEVAQLLRSWLADRRD